MSPSAATTPAQPTASPARCAAAAIPAARTASVAAEGIPSPAQVTIAPQPRRSSRTVVDIAFKASLSTAFQTAFHAPAGRRAVLVDIENLIGGVVQAAAQVAAVRTVLEQLLALTCHDQVIIGTCHLGLLETGLGWQGARLLPRSGPDGADLALIEVLQHENIDVRFGHVVVASGDGIFAPEVERLSNAGLEVTLVAPKTGCSRALRQVATRVAYLTQDDRTRFELAA